MLCTYRQVLCVNIVCLIDWFITVSLTTMRRVTVLLMEVWTEHCVTQINKSRCVDCLQSFLFIGDLCVSGETFVLIFMNICVFGPNNFFFSRSSAFVVLTSISIRQSMRWRALCVTVTKLDKNYWTKMPLNPPIYGADACRVNNVVGNDAKVNVPFRQNTLNWGTILSNIGVTARPRVARFPTGSTPNVSEPSPLAYMRICLLELWLSV